MILLVKRRHGQPPNSQTQAWRDDGWEVGSTQNLLKLIRKDIPFVQVDCEMAPLMHAAESILSENEC
jgi:hypothetical protein